MGVTISSPNVYIDLGYAGFLRLRRTVSELCPDDIRIHYEYMLDHYHDLINNGGFSKYDSITEEIYRKYHKRYGKVLNFLYASDCGAKMSYGTAKQLLQVIGDYDNDSVYGYAGKGRKGAGFRDFKKLLQDAYETKKGFRWS